ncbi:hypothetical protein EU537_10915 [Candidatus Thorarchaeota archaeon]|nr:MAG: hypothetical protein EU537_10915 [Candidatus Thorarchaeota archaeon]
MVAGLEYTLIPIEWDEKVQDTIESFPQPYRSEILDIWNKWIAQSPETPYYENWNAFSMDWDDKQALYTEKRVYLKRVTNELQELEVPATIWQKVARALAAVASVFLVVFLALSRVARASD